MTLRANWNYPTAVRMGAGRIAEIAEHCRELGIARPMVITDEGLGAHEMTHCVVDLCKQGGLDCAVYAAFSPNPTGAQVDAGVEAFRAGGHDGVIAFGGGSGLDAAKAVAFMAAQSLPLWDFEDVGDNWKRAVTAGLPPVIAVPTTSGTGSEVGRCSVITDESMHKKKLIFHPRILPDIALLDPELTLGLPPQLTAATGIDALSHSMEAFFSPFYHPMARGIATEGMRLVKEYLPRAVQDGSDIEARAHMMVASTAGAAAFQKGLGGMHAIAHSLGALYGAHHGLLNAILMPYVLEANREAIAEDGAYIARALGLEPSLDGLIDWVLELRKETGIAHTLAEIRITADEKEKVGVMSVEDPSAGGNPIAFTAQQYAQLFQAAVEGAKVDIV